MYKTSYQLLTFLFIILIFTSQNSIVFADSPLTSTEFSKAYQNDPIIVKASKTNGRLTPELINYLFSVNNPIDIKMALINELGWKFKGKANSIKFMKSLAKKKNYSSEEDFFNNGRGDELLCMGYMKAMDNYFEVDDAIKYAERALSSNSSSYTYQIITALLKAQKSLNNDWCQVYKLVDEVRGNTLLIKDMKDEAISIIFDYMDNYKESCNKLP